ncbi:hypothetical protein AVEN_92008-1 [Araneus ventricosus]|uniref:Uncharacterized protein n=1 Tax=Araneus ventricosus TaxID=182803 RepID=A0A4Y2FN44_ARAVE|nr:hypothetical protein AVEN_92008-1 [Araneus ventricosus]
MVLKKVVLGQFLQQSPSHSQQVVTTSQHVVTTDWPLRSPGNQPLDVFTWNFIKMITYQQKVCTLDDFKQRNSAEDLMSPQMQLNVWQEIDYRLVIFGATNSSRIKPSVAATGDQGGI